MYLLDTNIIVEFLRGRLPHTYRVFMRSDPRMFAVPAIVLPFEASVARIRP